MANIFNGSITLGTWSTVTNTTNIGGLFILEKQQFQVGDTIDIAKVVKATLEFSVDIGTGGSHKYIRFQRVVGTFAQGFIDNATEDAKTAVADVRGLPKANFEVRVISVTLDDGSVVTTGNMSCSLSCALLW